MTRVNTFPKLRKYEKNEAKHYHKLERIRKTPGNIIHQKSLNYSRIKFVFNILFLHKDEIKWIRPRANPS